MTGPAQTRPVTLVTGASSGIGRELALLAAATDEVVLVARSAGALEALAAGIAAKGGRAHAVAADLSRPGAAAEVLSMLATQGLHCRRLVNNAGFGAIGSAADIPAQTQLEMIDLNVRALAELTLAVLPGMVARGEGGILNVASVAAFLPGPRMAVYYATKAFVNALSEAIWQEARAAGVTVTSLCPGPVQTGFIARAAAREPGFVLPASPFHVEAAEVARQGWIGFLAGRRLVVPGLANRVVLLAARFLPRRLLIAAFDRLQSARPRLTDGTG